jgi:hypothetical protein
LFHFGTTAIGLGMGSTMASFMISIQDRVPWQRRGVATAILQFLRSIGATVGVAFLGAMLTGKLGLLLRDIPGAPRAGDLLDPAHLAGLAPSVIGPTRDALAASVTPLFIVTTLFAVACWVVTLWFPAIRAERPTAPSLVAD